MEQMPARTRRSLTNEFRRDAVAMVLDDGYKIVDVARRPARYSARAAACGSAAVGPSERRWVWRRL